MSELICGVLVGYGLGFVLGFVIVGLLAYVLKNKF